MNPKQLSSRTKLLAIGVIQMVKELPKVSSSQALANQIVRSATSVGANYRAACKSKSRKDFIYKLKLVEEELDETMYWLELIAETHVYLQNQLSGLLTESNELMLIIIKSLKTARINPTKTNFQKTLSVAAKPL